MTGQPTSGRPSPNEALRLLMEGNRRFVSGACEHPNADIRRMGEVLHGQRPFAVVVSCSDSRVPPEIIFDRGIGDMFVVRLAGNVVGRAGLASVEYAVSHLGAPLVLVLGHSGCGAVTAALSDAAHEGGFATIVERIRPSLEELGDEGGDSVRAAVKAHARFVSGAITASIPSVGRMVEAGSAMVEPAFYDMSNGRVELL